MYLFILFSSSGRNADCQTSSQKKEKMANPGTSNPHSSK